MIPFPYFNVPLTTSPELEERQNRRYNVFLRELNGKQELYQVPIGAQDQYKRLNRGDDLGVLLSISKTYVEPQK